MTFPCDRKALLLFAALLGGCRDSVCEEQLERHFVPKSLSPIYWQDAQTLAVWFGGSLRTPTEVDPGRFALLRYDATLGDPQAFECEFDLCYHEVVGIPESLSWNPADPSILLLHFAEPTSCEAWLELIYEGVDRGTVVADPDQLAYADDRPVEEFGPDWALNWLTDCRTDGRCEFGNFCVDPWFFYSSEMRVDCP